MSSAFGDILAEVVEALPDATGAVFLDWEGEAVDEVPAGEGDDLRLLGAHWTIAYYQARTAFNKLGLGVPEELVLRFRNQQILLHRVTDEYIVLLALRARGNVARALRLLRVAGQRLKGEM